MIALHKKRVATRTPAEQTALDRQINATDAQIDRLVYDLYGLTDDEIKILEETLHQPRYVIQSQVDPAAELSYRFYVGTKVGDKWLCVVVQYAVNDAFVVTGYLTDRVKKGTQLWPSK
jgi:hypothetical protein